MFILLKASLLGFISLISFFSFVAGAYWQGVNNLNNKLEEELKNEKNK